MKRLFCLALCLAHPLGAQQPAPVAPPSQSRPVVRAAPLKGQIRIDGQLNDAAWAEATPYGNFTQRDPQEGQPAAQRTEVRIVRGTDAIYFGLRMFDTEPSKIRSRLGRRDEPLFGADMAEVYIDSYHDRLTGFVFRITPAGAIRDAAWLAPGAGGFGQDNSWDAVWESAATIDSLGWTAELRIPFSQLRYNVGAADTTWGLQVHRIVARMGENSFLAFAPKRVSSGPQTWADLIGLTNLPKSRNIELLPYVTSRAEYLNVDPGDPFRSGSDYRFKVGGDLKYSLTSSMKLSVSVNPDFGQVEVDPARVNLSANELFFPERRPFFIEGQDIFRYARLRVFNSYAFPTFFHSRRIGRPPQRSVGGAYPYVDTPDEATIAGAVKLTGKTSNGFSIGVLDALTSRETARFATSTDARGREPVEPMTNYFVNRVTKDINRGATSVGMLVTAVNRDLKDQPLADILRRDSYFAGLDLNHSWKEREWAVDAAIGRSGVFGSPAAIARTQRSSVHYLQRPDLEADRFDPTRRSLYGTAWQLSGAKNSGEHWLGNATYQVVSPGFEVNDVGFHSLTAYRSLSALVIYKDEEPGRLFRKWSMGPFMGLVNNFDGDRISGYAAYHIDGQLLNFWEFNVNVFGGPAMFDDRLTRGGPVTARPAHRSFEVNLSSDERKIYRFEFGYDHYDDGGGAWSDEYGVEFNVRPSSALRFSFGPSFTTSRVMTQFITATTDAAATATYGRRYVFGSLRYNEISLESRVDWTFSPTLSLQMYLQPLVATGGFRDFRSLRRPRTLEFDPYVYTPSDGKLRRPLGAAQTDSVTIGNPNFNERSLLSNAVVRWEYRPGSALFFVWQQRREGEGPGGEFQMGRDLSGVFRTQPENVFAIKATYWIGR